MEDLATAKKDGLDLLEEEDSPRSYFIEALIFIMLIAMVIIYFSGSIIEIIPAGYKGVYFSTLTNGTQLNEDYDEGLHFKFPWDQIIIYNTRIQERQDTILGLTSDGLEIHAEISIRYFPDYHELGRIHKEIGPDYLNTILIPRITAITRDIVSRFDVEGLYNSRDSMQAEISQLAQYQITDNYPINVVDVVVRSIILPDLVMEAIKGKLVFEQKMLEYDYRLDLEKREALRKEIEARGIKIFSDTSQIDILKWEGIIATKELAKSENAKVVVIGTNSGDLPIILGGQ
jgi:regulator of protease activity HflC (stomatin/prohibitin superfamily)